MVGHDMERYVSMIRRQNFLGDFPVFDKMCREESVMSITYSLVAVTKVGSFPTLRVTRLEVKMKSSSESPWDYSLSCPRPDGENLHHTLQGAGGY